MRKLLLVALLVLAIPAQAQVRAFSQPELDALLAPVALYPDELVGHILVASAYPDQVGEAARGTPAQPHWHPSVTALLSYPELLQRMAESPQWMHDLSQAYIHQQASVMAAVQSLRTRASAYGRVPPPQPAQEVVYIRYYDPYVVYGPWWWPAYRPVFWHPWHAHYVYVRPPHRQWHPHRPVPLPRPIHVEPGPRLVHPKPAYVRVPEAQRRPIVNSAPQVHYKPRSFAAPGQARERGFGASGERRSRDR